MKKMTWDCANGCGEWTTSVPECFEWNGAEVFCVFCLVKANFSVTMAAAMKAGNVVTLDRV